MGRYKQPTGTRGSLKWIQRAVNQASPRQIDWLILSKLDGARSISWLSPLFDDDFSEYRDSAFLDKIGAGHLAIELERFWPRAGPQWDALGRSDAGDVLLVEAKAHIEELLSSPTEASAASRATIDAALEKTATQLRAVPRAPWGNVFYQLANRLAHLQFLRSHNVNAWLVLANFVGDGEMHGPKTAEAWEAAYKIVEHVLGLPKRHALSKHIIHIYPTISDLTAA